MDHKLIGNTFAAVLLAVAVLIVPWAVVGFALNDFNPQHWSIIYRFIAVAGMGAMGTGLMVLLMPDSYRG